MDDARIAGKIVELLDARATDSTICPSEVARALAGNEAAWRALMPEVRRVAAALARAGSLRVTQRGREVDASSAHGAIRLGRSRPAGT